MPAQTKLAASLLVDLEAAEAAYLGASGWKPAGGYLWIDPLDSRRGHIARKAAYVQRQRDAAARANTVGSQ